MSQEIVDLKLGLCQGARIVTHKGLNESFGHLSARIPGQEKFLFTTKGALGYVEPSDIEEVDFSGRKLTHNSRQGPPQEVFLHAEVYKARPDVNAIARTQSKWCEIFGIRMEPVRPVHDFGAMLMGETALLDQPILGDVQHIGKEMVEQLGDRNAILLRGNGSVVLGRSVQEAVVRAVFLDESAYLQFQARLLGDREVRYFSQMEIEKMGGELSSSHHVQRAFDNWLELATRSLEPVAT